jgi:hypothetical protein
MSERLACRAFRLARANYHRLHLEHTPTDTDAEMSAWLGASAGPHLTPADRAKLSR